MKIEVIERRDQLRVHVNGSEKITQLKVDGGDRCGVEIDGGDDQLQIVGPADVLVQLGELLIATAQHDRSGT